MASLARRNRACFVPRWPLVMLSTFLWRLRALTPLLTLGNLMFLSAAGLKVQEDNLLLQLTPVLLEIGCQALDALDLTRGFHL